MNHEEWKQAKRMDEAAYKNTNGHFVQPTLPGQNNGSEVSEIIRKKSVMNRDVNR